MSVAKESKCIYIDEPIFEYNRKKNRMSIYDEEDRECRGYKYIVEKHTKQIRTTIGLYELLRHYRVISKMEGKKPTIKYLFGGWFFV